MQVFFGVAAVYCAGKTVHHGSDGMIGPLFTRYRMLSQSDCKWLAECWSVIQLEEIQARIGNGAVVSGEMS